MPPPSEQATTTTLVFEGDLEHFLAKRDRGVPVVHHCLETASVKDVIESHGVPHTEVDGICCDGTWVDLGHRIAGGERVRVYPYECRADVPVSARLLPDPPDEIRFVIDGHLGTLCRRLRLCGFDCLWWSDPDDRELARVSSVEERVLLTRDVGLLKRRDVVLAHKVRATDPFEQTVEVVRRYGLRDRMRPFGRCIACNGRTEPVPKEQIVDRLEPGTRREQGSFRRCRSCGRIYWRGSHWHRLVAIVDAVREAASGAEPDRG